MQCFFKEYGISHQNHPETHVFMTEFCILLWLKLNRVSILLQPPLEWKWQSLFSVTFQVKIDFTSNLVDIYEDNKETAVGVSIPQWKVFNTKSSSWNLLMYYPSPHILIFLFKVTWNIWHATTVWPCHQKKTKSLLWTCRKLSLI